MCGLRNGGRKKGVAYAFSLCVVSMVSIWFIYPLEVVSGEGDWFGTVTIWETDSREYGGSEQKGLDEQHAGECKDTLVSMGK